MTQNELPFVDAARARRHAAIDLSVARHLMDIEVMAAVARESFNRRAGQISRRIRERLERKP